PAPPPRPRPYADPGDAGGPLDRRSRSRGPPRRNPGPHPGGPRRPGAPRTGWPRFGPRDARAVPVSAGWRRPPVPSCAIPAPYAASALWRGCPPRAPALLHRVSSDWHNRDAAPRETPPRPPGQTPLVYPTSPVERVGPALRPSSAPALATAAPPPSHATA